MWVYVNKSLSYRLRPPPLPPSPTATQTHAAPKHTRGAIAAQARHAQERQVSTCSSSGPKQHVHNKMQAFLSQRLQAKLSFVMCHEGIPIPHSGT